VKRICVITQDPRLGGGVLTKLEAFLHFAESRSYACDIFYTQERSDPAPELDRLQRIPAVRRLQGTPIATYAPHFVRTSAFGARCEIPDGYDAFQFVGPWLSLCQPFVRARVPFVAWLAGTYRAEVDGMPKRKLRHRLLYNAFTKRMMEQQERLAGEHASLVLADSQYSARNLERELGIDAARLQVLTTPIDLARFRPASGVPSQPPYIVSVSRLMRGKGIRQLIQAFRTVADRTRDVELHIVGEGPERADLADLGAQLGLGSRLRLRGPLHDAELIEAYRNARLFALASRQESLGIVVLEALACGLPVVSTASGGPADYVIPGKNGFLVPVGDVHALAENMLALLEKPEEASRMGAAGRRTAEEHFSVDVIGRQLDDVYARVFGFETTPRLAS
jgi:glycosyltransferase involved in cell wall biosynthesis